MTAKTIFLLALVCISGIYGTPVGLVGIAVAQQPRIAEDDPYRAVYAKRQMSRLDKDGDGSFEKAEDEKQWRVKQRFDSDRDGVLTLPELTQAKIRYLNSPGAKKLNVLYKKTTEEDLYLDIYYPEQQGTEPLPVAIYTHGGGWAAGSKQGIAVGAHNTLYLALLKKGFAVVAVNYRLVEKGGTVAMRDCVVDAKDAVRHLSKNSENLGLDPQRFFVHGDSAGGQIAQILLLSSPESFPGDPELAGYDYKMLAGVSWYGPCDFEKTELFNHDGRDDFRDRFGPRILKPDSDPNNKTFLYREMSPINYLTPTSPPLLMVQGDKDTTIPVHHAYYIQEKAKAANAPVEIMIIKNTGHNWRKVGSPIKPSVDAIVQKTVDFLSSKLSTKGGNESEPVGEKTTPGRLPEFSWDTLPRYVHVRKTGAFTPDEVKYLATFPLITFEKTTGSKAFGSTDAGTVKAAQAVKRINSATKVLFYRNVIVHYGGYSFDQQLEKIPAPFLVNKQGSDKLIRDRLRAYDLSTDCVRKWWVESMATVCNDDSIDGLFLDGTVKVLMNYLKSELPDGKKAEVVAGFNRMMQDTRQTLGPKKLMIANMLRARFDDGGLEFMNHFDGSYLEGFEHNVGGVSKVDYLAKGISTVQQAAAQGKIIALTLNIAKSSLGDGVDEQKGELNDFASVSQERLDYSIALFLIMAERYSYLNIHDGYDVNPQGQHGNASKLWLKSFPEYKKRLGPPQSPAERQGYHYTREFEHASVWLDIEAGMGRVTWK
ncbi:MAG: acetyl esterase/lipase [Mariniblastus sp.]|jgi:acetyl esterase/lipase